MPASTPHPTLPLVAARPNPHFERLGGAPAVARLVDVFYRAMDRRPDARVIRAMHAPDLDETRRVLAAYLGEWLGGPRLYAQLRGAPMLRRRHQPFDIDAAARDAWMACMREALAEVCTDASLRAELDAAFWKVADTIRNTESSTPPPERSMTTAIQDTAFARLDAEGRLHNSVLKAATHRSGRFGYRGDIALKFQAKLADEARPPEISAEQVIAVANAGEPSFAFLCGFLLSFESLKLVGEVLGEQLSPTGQYFFFVDNLDIAKKFSIDFAGTTFHILPIDESTVYNEMLQLLYIDKNDVKKLDTAGKTDHMADKALAFKAGFPKISYDECLKTWVGPVRNPYENRPV